ncbi:MAG TPA: hypothetical protein VD866_07770, partial [Urbifossiella sp.]|nr:hypothetical protein [Urbifossiella sp.]
MAQVKLLFYLPINDNDGRDLRADHLDVQTGAYHIAGGWTFLGFVEGAFRMKDGSLSLDRSAAYVVLVEEERIAD